MDWTPTQLADDGGPLYARLARAIRDDILRGRLTAGQRLPGTRTLAARLSVARNTVVAAYASLETEGWLTCDPARGNFVTGSPLDDGVLALPRRGAGARAMAREPGFDLGRAPRLIGGDRWRQRFAALPADTLDLTGGRPDPRLVPAALIGRTLRRVATREPALFDYAGPDESGRGHPRLRAALVEHLADARGIVCSVDQLLVTRGAQMALWLIAAALIRRGDHVAVERWGYQPGWQALRAHGARLHPLAVDARGLSISALEQLIARLAARGRRLRAVYVTPHHQYPTTVVLAPGRRLRLLALARQHRFAILEDDYDAEYHYDGRPVPAMAAIDEHGCVLHIGSFAKVLAPGLRIGWLVAPRPVVERCVDLRLPLDRQGDRLGERTIAELLEDGDLRSHLWRTRRIMRARRDALAQALERALADTLEFQTPPGGLSLWASIRDRQLDATAWAERALARGVAVTPGRCYEFRGRALGKLRIGFARHDEDELRRAVRKLRAAL